MGVGASSVDEHEGDEFPFFQMLQWVSLDLPENSVMTYDIEKAKQLVLEISADSAAFLAESPPYENINLSCFEGTDSEIWEDWAEALLLKDARLSELRFQLVPRQLSETTFWQKFFARAKRTLPRAVTGDVACEA